MTTINSFVNRLKKIGIEIKLFGNYPWVYLDSVNGVKITTKFEAEHGFTVFWRAIKSDQKDRIIDISTIFKEIRKALKCKN